MDPFTQRMLQKAEQRSRALGVRNANKFPETVEEANFGGGDVSVVASSQQPPQQQKQQMRSPVATKTNAATNTGVSNRMQVVEKKPLDSTAATSSSSPSKVMRQFSALDKENMDLGIEINIMTDKNVEVQVQVEEQDITDDEGKCLQIQAAPQATRSNEPINQPLAKLRDTSRNRLQRLGCLYSNTDDLSSPIHRTEAQFHAGGDDDAAPDASPRKLKQRYGKLAALATTINEWEDDTVHHVSHVISTVPPPKPDLPSRRLAEATKKTKAPAPQPPPTIATTATTSKAPAPPPPTKTSAISAQETKTMGEANAESNGKTKQLKWDPKVINSLEAQGFQRRESSTVKLAYDYVEDQPAAVSTVEATAKSTMPADKPAVSKYARAYAATQEEHRPLLTDKKTPAVKPGLVSGRAAAFEHKANASQQQQQRPQKDPTELSLKERMQLFEKNKGEALVPKAAFGMAPPISKIRQETTVKRDDAKAPLTASSTASSGAIAAVKSNADSKVRNKVAALVANATTISENKIKAEIQKQRQEDMQVLANRFNRQKELLTKEQQQAGESQSHQKITTTATQQTVSNCNVPLPPPLPPIAPISNSTIKRRSPGDAIDDENKRARTATNAASRLNPAISDLESNSSDNDNGCCTTATISATGDDANDNNSRMESDDNLDGVGECNDDSSVDICNGSLGREIMQVVQNNEHQQQQRKSVKEVRYADRDYYYGGSGTAGGADSSMNSSEASFGIDDYLDEALDGDDDCTQDESENDDENVDANTSRTSHGSKGTAASNSFSFRKTPKKYTNYHTINEENDDYHTPSTARTNNTTTTTTTSNFTQQPVKSELSVNQEDANMVTLVHTVSFYRKQQSANSANSTPVRKISREVQVPRSAISHSGGNVDINDTCKSPHQDFDASIEYNDETSDSEVDDALLVQDKMKKLLDEVCKQQQVIAQTSQALNLCAATIEFSGSTESVEGERHLLVATHRRQACLDEVQRLRVEKSLRPLTAPREKGRLTVKEITVPLRQDYIRKLARDIISGHHLVCLLKYNEHVLATKTVPTLPGLLAVKFPDVLQVNNVYADFRITLEIYGMTAHREVLPHEVKYHINLNKKGGIKTPKKKGSENRLVMPPVQSPAGPHVVRKPALVQYGFAIFSLREIQRTTWSLTQVLGVCPLEGVLHMKVNCELSVSVEYKGFLTMFEDISGFGAWHRRWCHLSGTVLNYWKYPDDERKKMPIGSIDFYTCTTQKVALAPRDICARLNTMLLECQRPALQSDQESLIIVPNGETTIVRHLLSADTKDEREQWCAYFNKALTLLRAWGIQQQ